MSQSDDIKETKSNGEGGGSGNKWIIYLVIFIGLAIAVNSLGTIFHPLFGALANTFGLADAVTGSILKQWKSCTKSVGSFFNPGSGCFLGIALIGGIFVYASMKGYKLFRGSKGNLVGEEAKALTGGDSSQDVVDILDEWDEKGLSDQVDQKANDIADNLGLEGEERENAIERIKATAKESFVNKSQSDKNKKIINESEDSPQAKEDRIKINEQNYVAESKASKEAAEEALEENGVEEEGAAEDAAGDAVEAGEDLVVE